MFVNAKPAKNLSNDVCSSTCLIDLAVYTRNRLFRILGSTKFGKSSNAGLRISSTNQFPFPSGFGNHKFYRPQQDNKSNHIREGNHNLNEVPSHKHVKAVTDWHDHACALAQTLVVPLNSSKINYPIIHVQEFESNKGTNKPNIQCNNRGVGRTARTGISSYPCLDEYVNSVLATRGGVQGNIRCWSVSSFSQSKENESDTGIITYQISRNRWCERIGRAHKSNNIMWNIDLKLFTCWQTCHDPDCQAMRFKGKTIPLPKKVKEDLQDVLFDFDTKKRR